MSINSLVLRRAKGKKYILFDFWDTIVHRRVHADTIKQIVAKRISEELDYKINDKEVYSIRTDAELFCYDKIGEFIYSELANVMSQQMEKKGIKPLSVERLEEIELDVEIHNAVRDEAIFNLISELNEAGYKICVVSDFYMGTDALRAILCSLGYASVFEHIFVSCICNCSKGSSDLYRVVLNELGIQSKNCLMIGDNFIADYAMARKCGIEAVHFKYDVPYIKKTKDNIEKELWRIEKKNVKGLYGNYAFSLFFFISRLYDELCKQDVNNVFFLAREGKILKLLFDEYVRNNSLKKIHSHYCYVSRRSTYIGSLRHLQYEDFETLFELSDYSISGFLQNLNFDSNEIDIVRQELNCSNLEMDNEIKKFKTSNEYKNLRSAQSFAEIYEMKREKSQKLLLRYFAQFGVDFDKEGLCIVDAGWKGTMQDNLYRLYGGKVCVRGYYIGLTQQASCEPNNLKHGLLLDYVSHETKYLRQFGFNRLVYEDILQADHPSTKEYTEKAGIVVPVFDKMENVSLINHAGIIQNEIITLFKNILSIFEDSIVTPSELEYVFAQIAVDGIKKCRRKDVIIFWEMSNAHYANFLSFRTGRESRNQYSPQKKVAIVLGYLKHIKTVFSGEFYLKFCFGFIKARLGWILPMYKRIVFCVERKRIRQL